MTREKAIKQIQNIIQLLQKYMHDDEKEALDIAIKELGKEPCKDTINREEVLNLVNKWLHIDSSFNLERALSNLPPVTPSRRKGHWITTRTLLHDGEYYCDKCKQDAPKNKKYKFCPSCGAKMD